MEIKFAIYGDIECVLQKIDAPENPEGLKSYGTQLHIPCSYGYKIVYHEMIPDDPLLNNVRIYRGENPMRHILPHI